MTVDMTEELNRILLNTIDSITKDIARAQGLTCDFVVSVSPLLNADYAIKAGYPPVLIVQSQFLMNLVLASGNEKETKKAKARLRRAMSSAVSKVPKMERSLSNTPPAEMLIVLPDKKAWGKTNYPDNFSFSLPDDFIQETESYTITLKEVNSEIEVSMTGTNPSKLRAQCRERLTSLVATNQALLERLEHDAAIEKIKPTSLEVKINNVLETEEVNYKYNEDKK